MYVGLHVQWPTYLSVFSSNFSRQIFNKNSLTPNFTKIHPVHASCSTHENGRTHMTKVIVVFRLKKRGGTKLHPTLIKVWLLTHTHTHTHTQRYTSSFFTGIQDKRKPREGQTTNVSLKVCYGDWFVITCQLGHTLWVTPIARFWELNLLSRSHYMRVEQGINWRREKS
jgi:hypothetical protein